MKHYAGLDVSNADTSICIVDSDNNIVKEGKVTSDPDVIGEYFTKTGLEFGKIGLETGSLSTWLVTGLRKQGLNVVCIDARVMAAILQTKVNKTDKNDAKAIANAIRCNNYREVHIKSTEALQRNALLTVRKGLLRTRNRLFNTARGVLKTFGIKLKKKAKSLREAVKDATSFDEFLPAEKRFSSHLDWSVIESITVAVEKIEEQLQILNDKLTTIEKTDPIVKRLMTHPGVGVVTACTFKAEIDDPTRFKTARTVGAYLGMTPRQYSSGEITRQGRISKQGSSEVRSLLHEAGIVLLTRTKKASKLKAWGLKKKKTMKTQKAAMAVGRKIGINLLRMWLDEKDFDPQLDIEEYNRAEEISEAEKIKRKEKKLVTKARNAKARNAKAKNSKKIA